VPVIKEFSHEGNKWREELVAKKKKKTKKKIKKKKAKAKKKR